MSGKLSSLSVAHPPRWASVRVGDVLSLINGFAFKPSHWGDDGLPIIRIQNLNNLDAPFNYSSGNIPDKFRVSSGDLLFAWSGTPGTSFGAHIWRGGHAWLNQHIFRVEFDADLFDIRFLQLAINQNLHEYIASAHGGAGLAHITKGKFEDSKLLVAPLAEQNRIVAEIDKQFTRLDAATAALKRVQANLKRYRASVLKAACEGRLVPTEAELARKEGRDYEPADQLLQRILRERRTRWEADTLAKMIASGKPPKDDRWKSRYKEPMGPDTDFNFEVPEGWSIASMDQLTFRITSGSRDWSHHYGGGTGTFVMAQNVRPGRLDLSVTQAIDPPKGDPAVTRCRIERDDLLVTIVGANTGDLCRVPEHLTDHYVCQSVALMRPVVAGLSSFIEAYMCAENYGQKIYKRYIYGAGRPHLGFEDLKATPVLLPPESEAKRVADQLMTTLSAIERQNSSVDAQCLRVPWLRRSILARAFSGKLISQNPDDEPAPVLLVRIRADRASGSPRRSPRRPSEPVHA